MLLLHSKMNYLKSHSPQAAAGHRPAASQQHPCMSAAAAQLQTHHTAADPGASKDNKEPAKTTNMF
jgi:hypothetical protein